MTGAIEQVDSELYMHYHQRKQETSTQLCVCIQCLEVNFQLLLIS